MKPQKSPFDVELKRPKRTTGKFAPSIWASIDLKAIVAEVGTDDEAAAMIEEPAAAAIADKQPQRASVRTGVVRVGNSLAQRWRAHD